MYVFVWRRCTNLLLCAALTLHPHTTPPQNTQTRRPAVQDDETRAVLRFTPLVAPVKATVFPLVQKEQLNSLATQISARCVRKGLGESIGRELHCPRVVEPQNHTPISPYSVCIRTTLSLTAAGLSNIVDTTGNTIGKR
jgi:hypothetical protein